MVKQHGKSLKRGFIISDTQALDTAKIGWVAFWRRIDTICRIKK